MSKIYPFQEVLNYLSVTNVVVVVAMELVVVALMFVVSVALKNLRYPILKDFLSKVESNFLAVNRNSNRLAFQESGLSNEVYDQLDYFD